MPRFKFYTLLFISPFLFAKAPIQLSDTIDINDLRPHLSYYLEDSSSGGLSISEILTKPFEKLTPGKKFGYSTQKLWVLLDLQNPMKTKEFVLSYEYPPMQKIEFYQIDSQGFIVSSNKTGRLQPFNERPVQNRYFNFPFELKQNNSGKILMSFQTTSSLQVPISIRTKAKFIDRTQKDYMFLGIYYGFILLILIYTLFMYFNLRKGVFLLYGLYLSSVVASQSSLHGTTYQFLWPNAIEWNRVSILFFVGLTFFFLSLFTIYFLNIKNRLKVFRNAILVYALLSLSISIATLFVYGNSLVKLTGLVTSILPLVMLPPAIYCAVKRENAAYFYLAGIFFYILGAAAYAMKDMGILSGSFLAENGIVFGSAIEVALFSLGLSLRIKTLEVENNKNLIEAQKNKAVKEIAHQMAHDIRSPLAALDMLTASLKDLPEDERIIMKTASKRIKDIANNLIESHNISSDKELNKSDCPSVELLSSIVEDLITEKRMEYRTKPGLTIETKNFDKAFGIFVSVDVAQFKRVLSNLINNSIEALDLLKGYVAVKIYTENTNAIIEISDNGKGIPQKLLPKIFERGVSYGKEGSANSGNGLGLSHAKNVVEGLGGKIEVNSILGHGTSIKMSLPMSKTPSWFLESVTFEADARITIIDDDDAIHHIWDSRLKSIDRDNKFFVRHLKDPLEFLATKVDTESYYFIDYEYIGYKPNGLDIIKRIATDKQIVLVTSYYEDLEIREKCEELGAKLLPKGLVGFVPMSVQNRDVVPDCIFHGDDPVHVAWHSIAIDS